MRSCTIIEVQIKDKKKVLKEKAYQIINIFENKAVKLRF